MERTVKDMVEDTIFTILYYIFKAFNIACIAFLLWIFLSWAEIAFTLKTPGTIPTYSAWNFFGIFF